MPLPVTEVGWNEPMLIAGQYCEDCLAPFGDFPEDDDWDEDDE